MPGFRVSTLGGKRRTGLSSSRQPGWRALSLHSHSPSTLFSTKMAALYATQPKPTTLPTHELLGFKPDDSISHQVQAISQAFLTDFEVASKTNDAAAFADLFAEDSFWRELLSFSSAFALRKGRALTLSPFDLSLYRRHHRFHQRLPYSSWSQHCPGSQGTLLPASLHLLRADALSPLRTGSRSSALATSSSPRPSPRCSTPLRTSPSLTSTLTLPPTSAPLTELPTSFAARTANGALTSCSPSLRASMSTPSWSEPTA
jgi:hypothetical protein